MSDVCAKQWPLGSSRRRYGHTSGRQGPLPKVEGQARPPTRPRALWCRSMSRQIYRLSGGGHQSRHAAGGSSLMVCRAAHVGPSKPHTIVVRSVPGRVSIAHCCCCSNPCVRPANADYHLTTDPLPAFLITMLPACHPSPLPQNKGFLELRSQALKHFGWQARRRRVDAGCPLCDSMRRKAADPR